MAPEVVQQYLQQVLHTEGVACDGGSLQLLARAARGSMRDALSLTDQAVAYGSGRLEESGVRAMLGAVDHGHAAALIDALARRDGVGLLARIGQLRELGLSADARWRRHPLLQAWRCSRPCPSGCVGPRSGRCGTAGSIDAR
jgi:DNA polymerase-3 subunit gamma/tau